MGTADAISGLQSQHHGYRFAWICALYFEMTVARAMLDEVHEPLAFQAPEDTNSYLLGSICQHKVVIACLPNGQYGTNNAANVVANLQRTFPSVEFGLMVGIGGGIPDNEDIRLGDIVVGTKIVQHDLGKTLGEGKVHRTGQPIFPPRALNNTITNLRSIHELQTSRISSILKERMGKYLEYCRPKAPDRLFQKDYRHIPGDFDLPCGGCDLSNVLPRSSRSTDISSILYGGIASGNQVLRDATTRGMIGTELSVLCFEMEAAGFMHVLDCLCIRGISDYSDSHKNRAWQKYAAAVAAAYARELLEVFPRSPQVHHLPINGKILMCNAKVLSTNARKQSKLPRSTKTDILDRDSMLKALKFPQMNSRHDVIEAAEGHTCRWFLANSHYQAWLDPEQLKDSHGFLWINGKPGAGKSVIMKFLSAEMRKQGQQTHGAIVSFFFNTRGSILQKSVSGMYRSLLHQIFEAYWDLPSILDSPEFKYQSEDAHLALDNLKALFKAAVLKLGRRRLTCFIDALDECDEQQALEMVYFFEDLTKISTKKDIPLRICFSSRPYPHMVISTSIQLTLEDQAGHVADMKSYISNNLRIEDPKLAEDLKLKILKKASGVFMWMVVVIPILNDEDRRGRPTMRRQLEELPDTLSNLFKDILTRDKNNPDDFLFSVLWVLFAKWPLTPEEYYHALWCGLRLRDQADAEIPDLSHTDVQKKINRYIVTSSKGLVEVTKSSVPTVQFVHESVRDFLLKENGLEYLLPHSGLERKSFCHDMLKQCCGVYLSLCSMQGIVGGESHVSLPFRRYCSLNILHHANAAAKHISQLSFLTELNLPILVQGLRRFQKLRRYTSNASLTYILAREGLSKLIPTWLEICPDIHIQGEEYKYPLFAAIKQNYGTTAALLGVARGSPDYQVVKRMEADLHDTPLCLACQTGDVDMARLLLNSRADINEPNKQDNSPFWVALKGGHDRLSAFLIERGADVDGKFHLTNMYLGLASSKGYDATAKFLLEKGAAVDSIAWSSQTPLLEASQNGHEDIVRLLVENGADVHACDPSGRSPLLKASSKGYTDIVSFLVQKGARVNDTDASKYAPLHLASRKNSRTTVSILIDNGANIDVSGPRGTVPLMEAIRWRQGRILRFLVERGADLTVTDQKGRTPLAVASRGAHPDVVKLLIEHGSDVNAKDIQGYTPLALASQVGRLQVAKVLVENGADVHLCNLDGHPPLIEASRGGHAEVVELLIQHGADASMLP
ncbi:unnamed protein product [Clonostachys rosea]|uniref:Nephrocystin 3-like N-terminal domain-containing protein n=1 Tax=Bionectria ochroleuca TaxID=29856 RepID=A0ABY6U595_BIOOC|nr:unnamed protein product [Clonostachys rosea]